VNSPVRAFKSVGEYPLFIEKAQGAYIYDADGNKYIDYMMSWGPMILGHVPVGVIETIQNTALKGTSFGASTEQEIELAELVRSRFPVADRVRLVNSGTESTMTAIRLARAATGRDIIVKFDGCYHGHSDALLVKAGSGIATGGIAGSAGVPHGTAVLTISLTYNNIEELKNFFEKRGDEVAGVIVEPVAANMGVVPPKDGFLKTLRKLTIKSKSVLIFDEVISGFRVARGGACELYGIKPDLICLGKIIGGGLPIGAIAGRKEIMDMLAPTGEVYQAGTLSGNPISVAAGIATLKQLDDPNFYKSLAEKTSVLADNLGQIFDSRNIPIVINHITGLLTVFFSENPINDYDDVGKCDMTRFAKFHKKMLDNGVYLPPSGFEAWFPSSAHTNDIIEKTIEAATTAVRGVV